MRGIAPRVKGDGTTVYYHNRNQIIETRDGSGDLVQQMYHGTQYIDELVGLRIADLGRLYVHQDANYNVVALSDMSGRFVERVYYSPYGKPEFVLDAHPFDYDDDGDVDAADIAAATTGGDCWGDYTGQDGDCKRLDADADRDIDADDHTTIVNYVDALPSSGELQRTPSSPRSTLGNAFAHQGLTLDAEIGSYQNRARQYVPGARRFLQYDQASYVDGLNLYLRLLGSPLRYIDPSGFRAWQGCNDDCSASYGGSGELYDNCMLICLDQPIKPYPGGGSIPQHGSDCCENCLPESYEDGVIQDALDLVQQWINDNNVTDLCKLDAMEHCVGAAELGATCGSSCSKAGGYLLEAIQMDMSDRDLHNNEIGADQCAAASDTVACCENYLEQGELDVNPDADGSCQ